MDTLILRTALLLSLPVSAVSRLQATDVLALSVASADRTREQDTRRELHAISNATLVNLAILAPERLQELDAKARERAGLRAAVPADGEAFLAALPLQESV